MAPGRRHPLSRLLPTLWFAVAAVCTSACDASDEAPANDATRPNIVFILADDLGVADTSLGPGDAVFETPNLERLARRGMRFTRAYAASPMCSATRASILTGQAPGRLGLTGAGGHLPRVAERATPMSEGEMDERPRLRFKRALIPRPATRMPRDIETLARALNRAGYATAHFGKWHLGPPPHDPRAFGFELDVPGTAGTGPGASYLAPWGLDDAPGFVAAAPGEHLETRLAREAIAFMEANRKAPFFLNYGAFSVHEPFSAAPDRIAFFERRLASIEDPVARNARATYVAMVEHFDHAVGELLDALERLGLAEETIVIVTSDNGASTYARHRERPVASNAPLRGGKATLYEGGIRVPAIVSWPGEIAAGVDQRALLNSTDWMPTLLELAAVDPATGSTFDGVSQAAVLRGGEAVREVVPSYLPHYFPVVGTRPASSWRRGPWKLIRYHFDAPDQRDRFELYDLASDPGESRDLARQRPEQVEALARELADYLARIEAVLPVRNPRYRPEAAQGLP